MSTKDTLDKTLQEIIDWSNREYICGAEPLSYTQAVTTYALGFAAIVAGDITGPENYGVTERKITIAEKTATISLAGKARWIVLVDSGSSEIIWGPMACAEYDVSLGEATIQGYIIIGGLTSIYT